MDGALVEDAFRWGEEHGPDMLDTAQDGRVLVRISSSGLSLFAVKRSDHIQDLARIHHTNV